MCVCGDYISLIQTFHHPTGHPTTKMKAPFLHPCHLSSGTKMDTLIGCTGCNGSKLNQARFHCGLGSNFLKKIPPMVKHGFVGSCSPGGSPSRNSLSLLGDITSRWGCVHN